jgi:hypothetical protein
MPQLQLTRPQCLPPSGRWLALPSMAALPRSTGLRASPSSAGPARPWALAGTLQWLLDRGVFLTLLFVRERPRRPGHLPPDHPPTMPGTRELSRSDTNGENSLLRYAPALRQLGPDTPSRRPRLADQPPLLHKQASPSQRCFVQSMKSQPRRLFLTTPSSLCVLRSSPHPPASRHTSHRTTSPGLPPPLHCSRQDGLQVVQSARTFPPRSDGSWNARRAWPGTRESSLPALLVGETMLPGDSPR